MATHSAPADSPLIARIRSVVDGWLHPHRLLLARVAWLALAAFLGVLIVIAAPRDLAVLQTPCTERLCVRGQVHVNMLWVLRQHNITIQTYGALIFALQLGCVLAHLSVSTIIFWRRSGDWMALLGAAMLLVSGVTSSGILVVLDALGRFGWGAVLFIGLVGTALMTYFFYLFPDGRFVPGWTRWLVPLWIGGMVVFEALPWIVGPSPLLGRSTTMFYNAWRASLALMAIYRYRVTATPERRRQTRWVLIGVILGLGGFALVDTIRLGAGILLPGSKSYLPLLTSILYFVLTLPVPLAFGMAILRARLYDIEIIVNRTLVYGALTACVVGVYVLVVGYLGTLFQAERNLVISLIATGLVAVLFQPLRDRLQRGVNRLMYGDRDEPYAVISRLGQRLETALAPEAVLPAIAQTVREALKLPYVAIAIQQDGHYETAASSGSPVPDLYIIPLVYQGETLGQLTLGPRAPGEPWSPADRRLLGDLARQAGTAVHAIRLTLDLQHARARLVTAREEERRRLRRDLHDGLGPVLAALALQADTARDLVRSDPDAAVELLDELTDQAQAAVVDIRRLVYALRPPALDDLGLVAALRAFATSMTHAGVAVVVEAPEPFPTLPAAVEVAAYRIVQEAVTNVVRHARARNCIARLGADDMLRIEVADDGRGLSDDSQPGIGLTSMRERARELGGDCQIEQTTAGGTRVRAWLPLS